FPVLPYCFAYPLELAVQASPALSPAPVLLVRVALGLPPSLHRLRRRASGFVRRFPRYYEAVRLPVPVHHRLASLDFSIRLAQSCCSSGNGTSRLPCRWFWDVAGSPTAQGSRGARVGAPLDVAFGCLKCLGALKSSIVSRLNSPPHLFSCQRFT